MVKSIKRKLLNVLHVQTFQGQSTSTETRFLEECNTPFVLV